MRPTVRVDAIGPFSRRKEFPIVTLSIRRHLENLIFSRRSISRTRYARIRYIVHIMTAYRHSISCTDILEYSRIQDTVHGIYIYVLRTLCTPRTVKVRVNLVYRAWRSITAKLWRINLGTRRTRFSGTTKGRFFPSSFLFLSYVFVFSPSLITHRAEKETTFANKPRWPVVPMYSVVPRDHSLFVIRVARKAIRNKSRDRSLSFDVVTSKICSISLLELHRQ